MAETRHTPEFHGRAGEYFGIWIVNLVLTVLTLGIYSAWAKVRTQRYFYANTRLADAPFEYLADPITILKGRLITYAVLIALVVGLKLNLLWLVIPLYVVIMLLYPWLIQLSLRFRARYSAWRGLRFQFDGTVKDAYIAYMLLPILAVFTMYLLIPWVVREQQKYMVNHHGFGGRRFALEGELGKYFPPFLIAFGLGIAMFVIFIVATFTVALANGPMGENAPMPPGMMAVIVFLYAGMIGLTVFVRTRFLNLMWNNTRLGEHRFESRLQARRMLWLYLSNGIAILFSLGMAIPWALVRMARYRLSCLTLIAEGSLDDFVASAGAAQSATGAEFSDALDLDLDIAL